MLTPVVLPPGLTSERTSPDPTMSSVIAMIGIVAVARCTARMATSPAQKNGIDLGFGHLHRNFHKLIVAHSIAAPIDVEVLAFDEVAPPHSSNIAT